MSKIIINPESMLPGGELRGIKMAAGLPIQSRSHQISNIKK